MLLLSRPCALQSSGRTLILIPCMLQVLLSTCQKALRCYHLPCRTYLGSTEMTWDIHSLQLVVLHPGLRVVYSCGMLHQLAFRGNRGHSLTGQSGLSSIMKLLANCQKEAASLCSSEVKHVRIAGLLISRNLVELRHRILALSAQTKVSLVRESFPKQMQS